MLSNARSLFARLTWSVIAGLSFAMPATAGRIDGLSPQQSVTAHAVNPVVDGERLTVMLDGGQSLVVTPWPRFLPRNLGKQNIEGERKLAPSGPTDQLSFTRSNETTPWLLVGNGAGPSTLLVGEWRLQFHGGLWTVSDGSHVRRLGHGSRDAMPAVLESNRQRWCLYLIDSTLPEQSRAGTANEEEPRIMWAARKLDRSYRHCTQPR